MQAPINGLVSELLAAIIFLLPTLCLLALHPRDVEMTFLLLRLKIAMVLIAKRKTVPDYWEDQLSGRVSKEFIVFEDLTVSYGQCDDKANKVCFAVAVYP